MNTYLIVRILNSTDSHVDSFLSLGGAVKRQRGPFLASVSDIMQATILGPAFFSPYS